MARKTRKIYRTTPEFFALPFDVRYDLVNSTVGNEIAQLGPVDEDGGFVMLARVDHEDVEYTLVIEWAADHAGYSVESSFTPARS